MANSLTFNGHDLSDYGLIVKSRNMPVDFQADGVLVEDISYAGNSKVPPKNISLEITVTASSPTVLKSNMDTIMLILNQQESQQLILDTLTDRYWIARFKSLNGTYRGIAFNGTLEFTCFDPFAYAVSESTDVTAIAADPDNAVIDAGGTALIRPVYTIVSDANDGTATIVLHSDNTDEEIEWSGALIIGTEIEIDCANWVVYKDDVEDMATVSGQFPTLVQDTTNLILTSGFTGSLTVTWRNRFV